MYIYGKNASLETINTNQKIKKIFLYKKFNDVNIIDKLKKLHLKINYLEKYELDNIVNGNHQGIILQIDDFKYEDIKIIKSMKSNMIVMLDHIEDPHNFGAIIRTCEAAGVGCIIIPKDRACSVNETVIKVSTGAINNISIVQVTNLNQAITYLKENNYWIIGTDMFGEDYKKIDYKGKICIVIGNEGHGMSELVKKNCDFIASIPMLGKVNSLNASVATGIIIFEAMRSNNEL